MKLWTMVAVVALATVTATVYFISEGHSSSMAPANAAATMAPAAPLMNENKVQIENFVFKPKELTVAVGTKVTWVNKDDVPHTATSSDEVPAFDSKALDTDDQFSFTFSQPGTYKYFCKVHPHMTGVVIVK